MFQQHTEHAEGNDTTPRLAHSESTERRVYKLQFRQKQKKITQPSGAATPRDSDAHERIAVPKALCVLRERTPGQDPKAAKYAVLIPGPGMFVNVRNAPRVVIAAPSGRPLFQRVCRCVRSFSESRVCTHFRL